MADYEKPGIASNRKSKSQRRIERRKREREREIELKDRIAKDFPFIIISQEANSLGDEPFVVENIHKNLWLLMLLALSLSMLLHAFTVCECYGQCQVLKH